MITVSARDFRESQSKFLQKALEGQDVILTTRDYGSFRLTPVTESDKVYSKKELTQMIHEAVAEYGSGETIPYTAKELEDLADNL